jgi:hypothetical protein
MMMMCALHIALMTDDVCNTYRTDDSLTTSVHEERFSFTGNSATFMESAVLSFLAFGKYIYMPVKAKCLAKYLDLTRLTLLTKVEVLDLD